MRYKDYPKHDFRRCLAVLQTVEDLGERATLHYVAQALDCTRAEVSRSLDLAQQQFRVALEKTGSVYKIACWGYVDGDEVSKTLRTALELDSQWRELADGHAPWTREKEAKLLDAVANAVTLRRPPMTDSEADVYRLTAQLLKTRYQTAAHFLDQAAHQFFKKAKATPRPFAKTVSDGLVSDVPRLRNLLERRMNGVRSW